MFRALINLRALKVLAQLDLDLSVRSALQIVAVFAALVLGVVLSLVPFIHSLGGSSSVFIGCQEVDRTIVLLTVFWISAGGGTYAAAKSWIAETAENVSAVEAFSCRALLGADVLSVALVERLMGAIFSACLLIIVSVGAFLHASPTDMVVLLFGAGIGIGLYCESGRETLMYLACPERNGRSNAMFRVLIPLCFVLVIATSILSYRGLVREVYIPQQPVFTACALSVIVALIACICCIKAVSATRGLPLGLPTVHTSQPITMTTGGVFRARICTVVRLFVARPLFSSVVTARWSFAMVILLAAIGTQHLGRNVVWVVALTFVTTLQTVNIFPDLLLSGRVIRFYYEESGRFSVIFAVGLFTRTLVILPLAGVMVILWRLVGGVGRETFLLAAIAVISDMLANGIAGSSHQHASQYSIAMSAFMSLVVTAIGVAFLWVTPVATVILASSSLLLAYTTWRKNVAYIT